MKKLIPLFFLASLMFSGCKKENSNSSKSTQSFLDSAISFLKLNLSQNDFDKLDISKNETLVYNGRNIGLQVFEKNSTEDKYLLMKVHSNKFSGNWVDMSNMQSITVKNESGTILLTSIDKKITQQLIVQNNAAIRLVKTNNVTHVSETIDYSKKFSGLTSASEADQGKMLPEVIIYYDVNPSYLVRYVSLYWSFDDDDDYSGVYHRSRGGGPPSVVAIPQFFPPDTPIDITKELECFTNNIDATYRIAININQPNPNSRDVITGSSNFMVGHTFLTFQQINPDGSSIIRNVGFYPTTMTKPGASINPSIFGDDSNTPFDVSVNFSVTGSEFMTAISTVLRQQTKLYDLNYFNCTDAPLNTFRSIGINLPATKSNFPFFNGDNPSDLGEDLRDIDLKRLSTENGNRKITRSVSNANNQKPPARQGGC